MGMLDLTKGPMVLEVPPKVLGRHRRLVVPLGHRYWARPGLIAAKAENISSCRPATMVNVPEGGYFVARARTNLVIWFARAFMENNDPKPVVEQIKKITKVYPYEAGGSARPSPNSCAARPNSGRSPRRRRPCSTKAPAR